MLNDYYNLNDESESKNYYVSFSNTVVINNLGVGILPKEIKRKDKLINKVDNGKKNR